MTLEKWVRHSRSKYTGAARTQVRYLDTETGYVYRDVSPSWQTAKYVRSYVLVSIRELREAGYLGPGMQYPEGV